MLVRFCFFASIAYSFVGWGWVVARYLWPRLRDRPRAEALQPLLILHTFRFIGLAFLVPGVVSSHLPHEFAQYAAIGDLGAATLALLALMTLRAGAPGIVFAWLFNVWGSVDLLDAFYQAARTGLLPGQLGAAYFVPTLIVPLLLITHGLVFRILAQHYGEAAAAASRTMAL